MKKLADNLVMRLKGHGFTIQRYDSMTSKSIYLKLDYGVSQSIRISDHPGKKHLRYRFNIRKDIGEPYVEVDSGFERYYYGLEHLEIMIEDIIEHRKNRVVDFGMSSYRYFMKKNLSEDKGKKGFWQSAKEV